jgi:rhodanese-related sulfurtransferase
MRRTLFILIGFSSLLVLGLRPASALSVTALQAELAKGDNLTVIDIRSPSDFAVEHIPGAINIPASLCPQKNLPPIGQVVVCGDGLGGDTAAAAAALAAKPGIKVEILAGGFAGWKTSQAMTTRGPGLKREKFNYISYAHLKASKKDGLVLYDLRKQVRTGTKVVLTDLNAEFPGAKQTHLRAEAVQSTGGTPALIVLIDSGDGSAESEARLLRLSGNNSYVILAGGEQILSRHGQAGLQHNAAGAAITGKQQTPAGVAQ